MELKLEENSCS